MKFLAILFIGLLSVNLLHAQRWSSAFIGKPSERALYASNVAKAIQDAWETEISSKDKKDMLLDEIIFGQESEKKTVPIDKVTYNSASNIDEISEVLGIKEEENKDPVKKKKLEVIESPKTQTPAVIPSVTQPKVENTTLENEDEVEEAKKRRSADVTTTNVNKSVEKKSALSVNIDDMEVDTVYAIPEIEPIFPKGREAMINYFAKNIKMPESTGIPVKGKVFVRFMVSKIGELSKVYLIKGLSEDCNKEALRAIKKMPNWIPAQQNGRNVNSWHTLPIYFEIE
jgi:periplasmic protein TonB